MRNAMFYKREIESILWRFKRGDIDRDEAHEQLRHWELLDVEIADALDAASPPEAEG